MSNVTMNLKDKLHEVVYVAVSVEKELPKERGVYVCLRKINNVVYEAILGFDGKQFKSNDEFSTLISNVTHWLKPTEQSYVLTGEELLSLKKQWCGEAWDVAFLRSGENMIGHLIEISNPAPDKQTFIDNLTI